MQAEVLFWIHSLLQERVTGSELDCGFSLWKACKQNGFRPLNAASCWPHGRLLDAVHHAEILELDVVSYRAEQARKRNSTKRSTGPGAVNRPVLDLSDMRPQTCRGAGGLVPLPPGTSSKPTPSHPRTYYSALGGRGSAPCYPFPVW